MEIRWLQKILVIIQILVTLMETAISLEQFEFNNNNNKNYKSLNNLNNNNENLKNYYKIIEKNKYNQINLNDKKTDEFIDILSNHQSHSRKKRLVWITDDGRLALPPGTALTITPTVTMPLVRYPPSGFLSNISFSFPVTMDFDKLGLTDNQNPLGDVPLFTARSFGKTAGTMLGNYIASYLNYREKRDVAKTQLPKMNDENFQFNSISDDVSYPLPPELPDSHKHAFHGGERALLYGVIEDALSSFGLNGKACLLRTICEIHSRPISSYGLFGEAIQLFLTPTKSPYAELLTEHVKAQKIGEGKLSPGECFPYYKDCNQSLFKTKQMYREEYNVKKYENVFNNDNNEILSDDVNSKSNKNAKIFTNKKLFETLNM